jgi:hypothetical protein
LMIAINNQVFAICKPYSSNNLNHASGIVSS